LRNIPAVKPNWSSCLTASFKMRSCAILECLEKQLTLCFKVSPGVAIQFPELPFAKIYGLRNQLTHGYWTVDLEILWNVIEKDVPELRVQIARVLESLENSPAGA